MGSTSQTCTITDSKVAVLNAKNDGLAIHRLRLTPHSAEAVVSQRHFATVQLRASPYRLAAMALKLD
jgi:hypothetical protein